jgi:hypothetical protein
MHALAVNIFYALLSASISVGGGYNAWKRRNMVVFGMDGRSEVI